MALALGDRGGTAFARSGTFVGESADSPPIKPWTAKFAGTGTGICNARDFQEIDCVRHLLAANVLAAAEQ